MAKLQRRALPAFVGRGGLHHSCVETAKRQRRAKPAHADCAPLSNAGFQLDQVEQSSTHAIPLSSIHPE